MTDYAGKIEPTKMGRPSPFDPEFVDRLLLEVALNGGNCVRALHAMTEHYEGVAELAREEGVDPPPPPELPAARTLRRWAHGTMRNRYHEICQGKAAEIEERLAQRGMDRATQADEVMSEAIVKTASRLSEADAVGASVIARNLAQVQKIQVENAASLRGRGAYSEDSRSLRVIAESLSRLGVVAVVNSTAEEIAEPAA